MTKLHMPLLTLIKTLSMHGILKYEQFSMSSALIDSTIEREVQRSLAGRKDFPTRLFFGMVGVGIMIFMIMLGGYILLQNPTIAGGAAAAPQLPDLFG